MTCCLPPRHRDPTSCLWSNRPDRRGGYVTVLKLVLVPTEVVLLCSASLFGSHSRPSPSTDRWVTHPGDTQGSTHSPPDHSGHPTILRVLLSMIHSLFSSRLVESGPESKGETLYPRGFRTHGWDGCPNLTVVTSSSDVGVGTPTFPSERRGLHLLHTYIHLPSLHPDDDDTRRWALQG